MLIIHAGLHKTGSTAIQSALGSMTREELSNFEYRGPHSLALVPNDNFANGVKVGFQTPSVPSVLKVPSRTERLLQRGKNVILSSEDFLGSMRDFYADAPIKARRMTQYFGPGFQFQVVIYLRPQYSWLPSVYTQLIQEGDQDKVKDFITKALGHKYVKFSNLVEDLTEELGPDRLVVRAYDGRTDVVADFLSVLGLPFPPRFLSRARPNTSLSASQVVLMRLMNEQSTRDESRLIRYFFQYRARHSQTTQDALDSSILPIEIQEKLRVLTVEDWQCLLNQNNESLNSIRNTVESTVRRAEKLTTAPYIDAQEGSPKLVNQAAEFLRLAVVLPPSSPATFRQTLERLNALNWRHPRVLANQLQRFSARIMLRPLRRVRAFLFKAGFMR